jgi:hypothetical protein
MTTSKPTNLKEIYFPHQTLNKVTGNPSYSDLQALYRQAKANAQSVPCTLGGGNNGHLGLIIDAITYARISPASPYIRAIHPGPITTATDTAANIAERVRVHTLAVNLFHETNLVEQIILSQISGALDESVMMPLIDEDTGVIRGTVQNTMDYLFSTYGNISDQKLNETRQSTINHTYVHADPIANVFNVINKYAAMAQAQGTPETSEQLISIGRIIITNANIFADSVEKWDNRPAVDKTWTNFKTHFTTAQKAYKLARPTDTVSQHNYTSQANIAELVNAAIDERTNQQLAAEAEIAQQNIINEHLANMAAQENHQEANSSQQQISPELQQLMQTLTNLTAKIQNNNNNNNNSNNNGNNGNNSNGNRGNYNNNRRNNQGGRGSGRGYGNNRQQTRQRTYCWTHGSCSHKGTECNYKADGHQDDATFAKMKGGSTKNCFWISS